MQPSALLARIADAPLRAALDDAARLARAHGATLWLCGESALALELALPCDAWTALLRATTAEPAARAHAEIREALRKTPGRLLWLAEASDRPEAQHVRAGIAAGDDAAFARRLAAPDCAPLPYACEPLDALWFDPSGARACIAAGDLPAAPCPLVREASLRAWSGLRAARAQPASTPGDGAEWIEFARRRGAGGALAEFGVARAVELGVVEPGDPAFAARVRALDALAGNSAAWTVLAALFDPRCDERDDPLAWDDARVRIAAAGLGGDVRHALVDAWRRSAEALRLCERATELGFEALRQSERLRVVRAAAWPRVRRLLPAWDAATHAFVDALDAFRAEFDPAELDPHPLLTPGDLQNARIPRGEPMRELLEEAFDLQLDGVLATREAAVSWLRARALELAMGERARLRGHLQRGRQLGGKTRRRPNDSG